MCPGWLRPFLPHSATSYSEHHVLIKHLPVPGSVVMSETDPILGSVEHHVADTDTEYITASGMDKG